MLVKITKDGDKNLTVLIKGIVTEDFGRTPIVDLAKLRQSGEGLKGIRLDSIVWAIQEKLGLTLWWSEDGGEDSMAMPMESRNSMRFDEGVESPRVKDGWQQKLYLSSFNCKDGPKKFLVILQFDKQ